MNRRYLIRSALVVSPLLALSGCARTVYHALEKVGIEKRDILIRRVEQTKDTQSQAKEQFVSALERFRTVVAFDAGELEQIYDDLNADYIKSERLAAEVSDRIRSVETVADDLFDEWRGEISSYSSRDLAQRSQGLLRQTEAEYATLVKAMKRAESTMQPVLTLFNDHVMFLRHNLNARAIGALRQELDGVENATRTLIEEMERSIQQAEQFIASMS